MSKRVRMPAEPAPSRIRLQPYLLFFPLGIVGGVLGVGTWVLFSVGVNVPNISLLHATLQSEGFLAAFVAGFLLTAFPRFTGADPAARGGVLTAFAAALAFYAFALTGHLAAAEVAFLAMMTAVIVTLAFALPGRTKPFPESFVLIGFALFQALAGPVLILASGFGARAAPLYVSGRQMVQLGFLTCAVLAIVGRLAPFLMGYFNTPPDQEKRVVTGRFWPHALAGFLIVASFLLEPIAARAAAVLRAVVVVTHLAVFARIFRPIAHEHVANRFFAVSTWMVATGFVLAAAFPAHRIGALHVIFIGGFSLMIFSFGSIIVLSHGSRAERLAGRMVLLQIVCYLTLLGLGLRVTADFLPNLYLPLLHSAGGCWALAAILWLFHFWSRPRPVSPASC